MRAEVELYAHRASPVHAWDARWKLAAAGLFMAVLVSLQTPAAAALGVAVAFAWLAAARLPARQVLGRLGAAQIILLPCLVILPFSWGGETTRLGPLNPSLEGLRLAGLLYLRALAIVTLGLAVVYSTPMVVLLRALQAFRLPRVLVEITLLTYRYLFTLWWELTRMRWALAARGFQARGSLRCHRTLAQVVGVSLVRSVERTERIQLAMRCRGFQGRLRTLQRFHSRRADWLKALAAAAGAVALLAWERHAWGGGINSWP
jgi:cobalt/nickel transport system permease protein